MIPGSEPRGVKFERQDPAVFPIVLIAASTSFSVAHGHQKMTPLGYHKRHLQ